MEQGTVRSITSSGITTISFFHPQGNSLPGSLLEELAASIDRASIDSDCKVIILKSEGDKAFCAGASFDELISIKDFETGKKFFSGFARVINSMRKSNKLIIGRIHQKSVGGGVGLAASVDYCFATQQASVKLSELAVGIGPFVVGPAVERKIGLSAMSELAINATEWRDANWAREKGLYNHVFPGTEEMDASIEVLASRLANSNPEAMLELKRIFWTGTENWDALLPQRAEISGRLVLSEFTIKAIQAFKKK